MCFYCNIALTKLTRSLEHLQPLTRGGTNGYHNLTLSCKDCNLVKGDLTVAEFADYVAANGGIHQVKKRGKPLHAYQLGFVPNPHLQGQKSRS